MASLALLGAPPVSAQLPSHRSMVQLIAQPEQFDGQVVRVIGFMHLEFEGDALYLHKDDYRHGIHKNGLHIEVPPSQAKAFYKLNDRYVLIEGEFSTQMGHLGMNAGSMKNITRIADWSGVRLPAARKTK